MHESKTYASKKKLADTTCSDLVKYALIEEEIFYPAVQKVSKEVKNMVDAIVDHASAKNSSHKLKPCAWTENYLT